MSSSKESNYNPCQTFKIELPMKQSLPKDRKTSPDEIQPHRSREFNQNNSLRNYSGL